MLDPERWRNARLRPGKHGLAVLPFGLIIVYIVGLTSDTWVVVYKKDMSNRMIANMGLFKACGYDINLQVQQTEISPFLPVDKTCISLFQAGVPGWLRSVQVLSILCPCLLFVSLLLWAYLMSCSDLDDKRVRTPFLIIWFITCVMLLIHPIIFASHIRPDRRVTEFSDDHPRLYDSVVIKTLYMGAFYLHCVVAGVVNFITLLTLCCIFTCS